MVGAIVCLGLVVIFIGVDVDIGFYSCVAFGSASFFSF